MYNLPGLMDYDEKAVKEQGLSFKLKNSENKKRIYYTIGVYCKSYSEFNLYSFRGEINFK